MPCIPTSGLCLPWVSESIKLTVLGRKGGRGQVEESSQGSTRGLQEQEQDREDGWEQTEASGNSALSRLVSRLSEWKVGMGAV